MAIDRSVLDEVIATVAPVDARRGAEARAKLPGAGVVGGLAAQLAALKRTLAPPVERKVIVACAADHGDTPGDGAAEAIRALVAGRAPLSILARAAGARLVIVDSGVRGGAAADFANGVVALRIGDGTADARQGAAMSEELAITALQTGIALVLSLASEGCDALAACAIAPGAAAAAERLTVAGGDPIAALAAVGGYDLAALAGMTLAAAAIRVPMVVSGAGAQAAATLATRLAADAAGAIVRADAIVDAGDLPAALLVLDAAARLLREL